MPVTYRPMREEDLADGPRRCNVRAFDDLDRRRGTRTRGPPPARGRATGASAGCSTPTPAAPGSPSATARSRAPRWRCVREGLWGLSLLVVDPPAQGAGAGRELLGRARAYGNGARGHVILSSTDPRAMRAYARLGLAPHPRVAADAARRGRRGAGRRPRRRPGGPAAHRGRRPRGPRRRPRRGHHDDARHRRASCSWRPSAATPVLRGGQVRMLRGARRGGRPDHPARRARPDRRAGEEADVEWLSAPPAVGDRVCVEARLRLDAEEGCVFTGGDVGPFSPYLPSGAYL